MSATAGRGHPGAAGAPRARLRAGHGSVAHGRIFRNPTTRIRRARQTGGVIQSLDQTDIDEVIAAAAGPDLRLIVALAAVHAARPKTIRTMQLGDVDCGNRRITVGGHVHPLDDGQGTTIRVPYDEQVPGLPAQPGTGGGHVSPNPVSEAWKHHGTRLKGLMTWSINWDGSKNRTFGDNGKALQGR